MIKRPSKRASSKSLMQKSDNLETLIWMGNLTRPPQAHHCSRPWPSGQSSTIATFRNLKLRLSKRRQSYEAFQRTSHPFRPSLTVTHAQLFLAKNHLDQGSIWPRLNHLEECVICWPKKDSRRKRSSINHLGRV